MPDDAVVPDVPDAPDASAALPGAKLRRLLEGGGLQVMPCCYDALSARLVEQAGFPLTFMSGFAVSAARLGAPDTGLISYAEMLDQGRNITAAVSIPVLGDADTGYGNALNVKRTIAGYAQAGFAAAMIEDQVAPKRCGHTRGKEVVPRELALDRIRAAVDARDAARARGQDLLILARTDARHGEGLGEAIARAQGFADLGADILFVEAPRDAAEMETVAREVPGWKMANLVEGGDTPLLGPPELEALGFAIAAYPLTLLSAAMRAQRDALAALRSGTHPSGLLMDFAELRERVGFEDYYAEEACYAGARTRD